MIETFNAYRALTAADRRLVREAATLLLLARLGVALVPFSSLRTTLGANRRRNAHSPHSIERLVWSVTTVVRRVPFRTTCLIDALAIDAMLRRRGVASDIRFGVKPPDGRVLAAHAWVEVEGRVVYGAISDLAHYAVLSADGAVPSDHASLARRAGFAVSANSCLNGLLAIVRGEPVAWDDLAVTPAEFLDACEQHELSGIAYARLSQLPDDSAWPPEIGDELARRVREEAVRDMLRREELADVLRSLDERGIDALVLKGTALAYTVYETPGARPRLDTDLLIDSAARSAALDVLERHGYAAPPYCADLFSQCEMIKTDEFGVTHVVDVHWKISTQAVFADALSYEELLARAVPLPALGPRVMTPCAVDALLLACMHPVMHHQNQDRLVWIYDIHLLARGLTGREFEELGRVARAKNMRGVCAHGLRRAQTMFNTPVPAALMANLDAPGGAESSAQYLASERRWHHETIASLRALPRVRDRARMLRDVLLPSPAYMLGAYGVRGKPLGPWLLPALYVHRNVRGAWRILAGKK